MQVGREGYIQNFVAGVRSRLFLSFLIFGSLLLGSQWLLQTYTNWGPLVVTLTAGSLFVLLALVGSQLLSTIVTQPTRILAQAILHISPTEHLVPAPKITETHLGRPMIESLTRQIYNYGSVATSSDQPAGPAMITIIDQLPLPIIGLDDKGRISLANINASSLFPKAVLNGRRLSDVMELQTEDNPDITAWAAEVAEHNVTSSKTWQKVKINTLEGVPLGYFDIAGSYNKHSSSGSEILLALQDHSDVYDDESASISFVAMAVHELRTPLTILRGYIEAFEDELGPDAHPQLQDDLKKMNASAQGLSTFVSSILNVARVEQGALSLNLQSESWNTILPHLVDGLRNRAGVYGKNIELRMQPDLPPVALDRTTIDEVITNLIDNAIKYSPGDASDIRVSSRLSPNGLIETTISDSGVGIPSSVLPHLFSKFQRNHRNRTIIGGTGLGLFLCKAIISAHSGNIWVKSSEGKGSTFGFTLLPYSQLAKDQQSEDNKNIVRGSHGWIKNHNMQRH
jgi:signal transduction histidine kinase